jgi:hypothetical protein
LVKLKKGEEEANGCGGRREEGEDGGWMVLFIIVGWTDSLYCGWVK